MASLASSMQQRLQELEAARQGPTFDYQTQGELEFATSGTLSWTSVYVNVDFGSPGYCFVSWGGFVAYSGGNTGVTWLAGIQIDSTTALNWATIQTPNNGGHIFAATVIHDLQGEHELSLWVRPTWTNTSLTGIAFNNGFISAQPLI